MCTVESPGEKKLTSISDSHSLSIPAATRHVHNAVTSQPHHQGGHDVVLRVAVPEATVVSTAPGVELPGSSDCSAVGAAHRDLHHMVLLGQLAHQGRLVPCSDGRGERCNIKVSYTCAKEKI